MLDEQQLLGMPRRELQDLAKANGIRANLKSSEIIKKLLSSKEIKSVDENSVENIGDENGASGDADKGIDSGLIKHSDQGEGSEPSEAGMKEQIPDKAQIDPKCPALKDQLESAREGSESPEADLKEQIPVSEPQIDPQRPAIENQLESEGEGSEPSEAEMTEQIPDSETQIEPQFPALKDQLESAKEEIINPVANPVSDIFPENEGSQEENSVNGPALSAAFSSLSPRSVHVSDQEPECEEANSGNDMERDVVKESSRADAEVSENVQEALDTYRKIAMESSAALDNHGCKIPETPASKKTAVSTQKKATGKNDPASAKTIKPKFDLQESLSRPINWEMKKGPLPPVSVQILEDPNRLCLWSPSRMAERKKEFKNNDFGGTKRRLEGYLADGRSKLSETVRDHRKAQEAIEVQDKL